MCGAGRCCFGRFCARWRNMSRHSSEPLPGGWKTCKDEAATHMTVRNAGCVAHHQLGVRRGRQARASGSRRVQACAFRVRQQVTTARSAAQASTVRPMVPEVRKATVPGSSARVGFAF